MVWDKIGGYREIDDDDENVGELEEEELSVLMW